MKNYLQLIFYAITITARLPGAAGTRGVDAEQLALKQ